MSYDDPTAADYDPDRVYAENQRNLQKQQQAQGFATGNVYDPTQKNPGGDAFAEKSAHLAGESRGQRYLNMQKNYAYGGDPFAADRAIAEARATAAEAGGRMGTLGHNAALTAAELQGAQAPVTNYRVADMARGQQQQAYAAMMAAGQAPEGPSAAGAQLQAGTNQALAANLAAARGGRGLAGSAAGMNAAAMSNAAAQQGISGQAASLRASENQAYLERSQRAFAGAGALASDIRTGDTSQSKFLTETELKNREIADQAGLGFTNLAQAGYQGNANTILSGEQLANAIQMERLKGTTGYEGGVQNYILHKPAPGPGGPNAYDYAKSGVAIGSAGMDFYNAQYGDKPEEGGHSSGQVIDEGSY